MRSFMENRDSNQPSVAILKKDQKLAEYDANTNTFKDMDEEVPLIQNQKEEKEPLLSQIKRWIRREHRYETRTIHLDRPSSKKFPANVIRNQKYNPFTFLPVILYEQFRFFYNLYFLIVALSQFIPALQVGFLFTYISPLAFVLAVTILKEAYDDFKRFLRDKEANSQKFHKLTMNEARGLAMISVPSSDIKVGDLILVDRDQRVPADMIFLRTTEKNGASFIRTDQLDGETDWKLRRAVSYTQKLPSDDHLIGLHACVFADKPKKDIYSFVGNFIRTTETGEPTLEVESLSVENTIWANTVVASGRIIGLVVYTGRETRSVMNTSAPATKSGLIDNEINNLSKILCVLLFVLSFVMMALKGFQGPFYIYFFRFMILFSSIIPISLRVNLDMAKTWYSFVIMQDKHIPGTVVRSSTIPEELGRIEYLLSDKTGTLTQNDMVFKKLHLGSVSFSKDTLDEVQSHLEAAYQEEKDKDKDKRRKVASESGQHKIRRTITTRVREAVRALALCHNVTPVNDDDTQPIPEYTPPENSDALQNRETFSSRGSLSSRKSSDSLVEESTRRRRKDRDSDDESNVNTSSADHEFNEPQSESAATNQRMYQASSPDEIALVKFAESVNLVLVQRDVNEIVLQNPLMKQEEYEVLNIFPFTSETKRMGIIVRKKGSSEIVFYMKGADVVMAKIVQNNDWLEEECGNMAREGLRTLVFGKRNLTEQEYQAFLKRYQDAKTTIKDRDANVRSAIESIENELELICLTGVEDKLQENVKPTLEMLSNAGVKIWMLTGDKMETAKCIAISARLVKRNQAMFEVSVKNFTEAMQLLQTFSTLRDACLVIDGNSLQICFDNFKEKFIRIAAEAPCVVCCRCSPTQKAEIVKLIKDVIKARTCAIGDGGNDVSMIQAADVGIGIVGKEGKQASLAADFSVNQFSYISRLLLWHGRNSYKRSARLSQFIIHRGLIISFIQAVFSAIFYFAAIAIYNGWLLVGYSTTFTMAPVFSLVLDEDVSEAIAFRFPELYQDLQKGRSLSYKTFFTWVFTSVYQGGIIMLFSLFLFVDNLINIVSITFTALILTELANVAFEIHTWNKVMVFSELGTLIMYIVSMILLPTYFDFAFITTGDFLWRVIVVTLVACLPLYIVRLIKRKLDPPSYSKLSM